MMAVRTARHLKENDYRVSSLVKAGDFARPLSRIYYKRGEQAAARTISMSLLSIPWQVRREDQIETFKIELGADLLNFDRQLVHLYKRQADHVYL